MTTATCADMSLSNELDAYQVRYERVDIGTITESWVNNPDVDLEDL